MRVLISGLPLFSKRLADDLQEFDSQSSYHFLDTYNSKWAQLKFLLLLPFSDVVISMNGVTDSSGSLDWVVRFKKKLIMQWMGTDSLIAVQRSKEGTINRKYIDYATHFVDAPWLEDELKQIGVISQSLHFKYISAVHPLEKYSENSVFSYLAQGREDFYGLKTIVKAAESFPELTFNLCGFKKSPYPLPSNINVLGWLSTADFTSFAQKSSVFLRLPEHDGFSVSVIESLGMGSEVLWTFKADYTTHINDSDEIVPQLKRVLEKVKNRGLVPNKESIDYVRSNFNRADIIKKYIQKLHSL